MPPLFPLNQASFPAFLTKRSGFSYHLKRSRPFLEEGSRSPRRIRGWSARPLAPILRSPRFILLESKRISESTLRLTVCAPAGAPDPVSFFLASLKTDASSTTPRSPVLILVPFYASSFFFSPAFSRQADAGGAGGTFRAMLAPVSLLIPYRPVRIPFFFDATERMD